MDDRLISLAVGKFVTCVSHVGSETFVTGVIFVRSGWVHRSCIRFPAETETCSMKKMGRI